MRGHGVGAALRAAFRVLAMGTGLALLQVGPLAADDTDIFAGPGTLGTQRVMLVLDTSPGMAAPVCADAGSPQCRLLLGPAMVAQLDLWGLSRDDSGTTIAVRGADGAPDTDQVDPAAPAGTLAGDYWTGVPVTRFDLLRAALRVALAGAAAGRRALPQAGSLEVGLMGLHAATCPGAGPRYLPDYTIEPPSYCSRGAYVLQGFVDIARPENLLALQQKLAAIPAPGSQAPWMAGPWEGHPYPLRDVYLEFHRYLTGGEVFNGFLGPDDYGSREPGNLYHTRSGPVTNDVLVALVDDPLERPLLAPDAGVLVPGSVDLPADRLAGARYRSPLDPGETCASIALVHVLSAPPVPATPDTDEALAATPAAGGIGLRLAAGADGDRELVAALAGAGSPAGSAAAGPVPSVRSFFLAAGSLTGLDGLAAAGGSGRVLRVDAAPRLRAALASILDHRTPTGASLVAPAYAIDARNRARVLDDLFFPLFEAGPDSLWQGNVKKLKAVETVATDPVTGHSETRRVVAQAPLTRPPRPALSEVDGQILPDALTFWTDPAGRDVLAFDPARGETSGRDGRSVSRGGAGQQLPGFLEGTVGDANSEIGARRLYTLDPGQPDRLLPLDVAAVDAGALDGLLDPSGGLDRDSRRRLLRWIRGQDAFDEDGDGDVTEPRDWYLGAVIHSRPLAVNYGAPPGSGYSDGNQDVRLLFGSADGILHMVRNTGTGGTDPESGREVWGFVPPEFLALQAGLARGGSAGASGPFYGVDGEPVALVVDRDRDGDIEPGEDRVWVFVGQRRGGRALYAFDLTDPDEPRFKWRITPQTPGFGQLALTFSTPGVARLDPGAGGPVTALVFGGGYHGGWEGGARVGKDAGAGDDTVGNAIYVVDAETGGLIWRAVGPAAGPAPADGPGLDYVAAMTHSIPSPVTVVDSDNNGIEDRAYVGDTGGNVWRVDFTEFPDRRAGTEPTGPDNWYVTRLAALGGSGADDRRFFHEPDFIRTRDDAVDYHGVVILSGNRAAPRDTVVQDYAYLLKDRRLASGPGPAADSPRPLSAVDLADLTGPCPSPGGEPCPEAGAANGWRLALEGAGEKGLSRPLTRDGVIHFTSYLPPPGRGEGESCSMPIGSGRLYAVRLSDAAPALSVSLRLDDADPEQRFLELPPGIPAGVVPLPGGLLLPATGGEGTIRVLDAAGAARWRIWWREEGVDYP